MASPNFKASPQHPVRRMVFAVRIVIALCIGMAVLYVLHRSNQELEGARAAFVAENREEAQRIKIEIERALTQIYQGLRTIARLPTVRRIDRYGKNFTDDGRVTTQEIYNNLASTVAMSEVYIVPRSFHPDQIDPVTGALEIPITTFDQLILGKTAIDDNVTAGEATESEVEEIEIFEYRLMRQQLDWFEQKYAREPTGVGLDYPVTMGPEVITCDNSHYDPGHPNDADRSGFVISVPFFDSSGALAGMISGVILTSVVQDILENSNYALRNKAYHVTVQGTRTGVGATSTEYVQQGIVDPNLIYSDVHPLGLVDGRASWLLWSGASNEEFWGRSQVKATIVARTISLAAIGILGLAALIIVQFAAHAVRAKEEALMELEHLVQERTRQLLLTNAELLEAIEHAQASRTKAEAATKVKSQFLANMSHEIRTPLNGIIGMTEIVLGTNLTPDQREDLRLVQSSSKSLLSIINDILDFSKIEAGKLHLDDSPFSVQKTVSEVVKSLNSQILEKGQIVVVQSDPSLPDFVRGDELRVRQIIMNLLGNAIKFTPLAGGIYIQIGVQERTDKAVTVILAVNDTGIGMAEDVLARIFDPFEQADSSTTRQFGGTGLGLSIVTQLIKLMGGTLEAQSRAGVGTSLRCQIPFLTNHTGLVPEAAGEAPEVRAARANDPSLQILLVEDNTVNQRLARKLLERRGHRVDVVENGQLAVDWVQRSVDHNAPLDLILMDCQMPVMDGFQAARCVTTIVSKKNRKIPIIALTANAMDGDAARCFAAGMCGFVSKPILPEDLEKEIHRVTATIET